MKRQILFCGLVLLAMLHATAFAQSKGRTTNNKPVTVTLVRWPYT